MLKVQHIGEDQSYDIEFVKKAVQFVIDNASDKYKQVRGPIDVAVIRRFGGINWIQRKPRRYSEDLQASREERKW